MREFVTPMMQQFAAVKAQYPDCLIFFRLGDFYELFMEDATTGAQILGITLTKRPSGKDGHIPMAGVPYHAADVYLAKLVKAGHKVAICEQLTPPNQKGLVQRSVVRIVTPGTVLDEKTLAHNQHNYVMSLSRVGEAVGLSFADISTGDWQVTEFPATDAWELRLKNELAKFQPVECSLSEADYADAKIVKALQHQTGLNIYPLPQWSQAVSEGAALLQKHLQVSTLQSFGLADRPAAQQAAANLISYLEHTQQQTVRHMRNLIWFE